MNFPELDSNKKLEQIEDIIITFDKIFKDVPFDLEESRWGNGMPYFAIIVGDYDFYMKDKKFLKWKNIFRKKYPRLDWTCFYKEIK